MWNIYRKIPNIFNSEIRNIHMRCRNTLLIIHGMVLPNYLLGYKLLLSLIKLRTFVLNLCTGIQGFSVVLHIKVLFISIKPTRRFKSCSNNSSVVWFHNPLIKIKLKGVCGEKLTTYLQMNTLPMILKI